MTCRSKKSYNHSDRKCIRNGYYRMYRTREALVCVDMQMLIRLDFLKMPLILFQVMLFIADWAHGLIIYVKCC